MKRSKKIIFRNFSILILSLLMLTVGVGCVYAESLLNRIHFVDDASSRVETGSLFKGGTESEGTVSAKAGLLGGMYHDDAITNILLLGVDDYQQNDIGRSDSMLMVSVDTRHKKLKLTSFMRDLYVAIPGHGSNKLNAAYSLAGGESAGAKSVVRTIEANFGVDIDRYVIIGNSAFNQIIDRLGGVDITLTNEKDPYGRTEADLINLYSGDKSKVRTGLNTLSGAQAHYYSRIRAIGDDFERTKRQRKVFSSLTNKFKTASLNTIYSALADTLNKNLVTTNMTKNEILSMASNSLTYLNYPSSQLRIPGNGEYTSEYVPAGESLVPDLDACRESLTQFLFEGDIPEKSYGDQG